MARVWGHDSESLTESLVIDGPQLIEDDTTGLALKTTPHAIGICMHASRERSNNGGAEVLIELIGRDNQTRARLSDLPPPRWIEFDEKHLAAPRGAGSARYHSHSV